MTQADGSIATAGGNPMRYTYGPYGETVTWAGSRFRYTGQIAFQEMQLYHYKARAYDPNLGRFLQTDPIGQKDDPNLYAYVKGDPENSADPTGLCTGSNIGDSSSDCGNGSFTTGAGASEWGSAHVFGKADAPTARTAAAGAVGAAAGGTIAVAASGACDVGTAGVCAPANPAIVGTGIVLGAATGVGVERAWTQLERLVVKAATSTGPTEYQYALVAQHTGPYPDVRNGVTQLSAGDVWKYGTTVDPGGRYAASALQGLGLQMRIQSSGNNAQVLVQEKFKLIEYYYMSGKLPPGNRIFK